MEHEAEGHGQDHIKAPGDRSPVEQGVGGSPVLDGAQVGDVVLAGIQHPFTEGIEQDIGGQPGGEHHGTPLEGGILRPLKVPQPDLPVGGEGHVQGAEEDA